MIITIISLVFLFLVPLIPVRAQTDASLQSKDTLSLEEFACIAKNPATLKECINQVRTIKVPLVKIDAPIICASQNDCAFDFTGINTDTTFYATRTENKIIRSNDFSYTVFNIDNSSGLKFSGLTFQDDGISDCPQGTVCPPVVVINKSGKIIIERTSFADLKGTALFVSDSRTVTIDRSNFSDGLKDGIRISSSKPTGGINITGNNFDGISGNAVSYQAVSTNGPLSTITSNTFTNNHAKGFYENCTYPCTGSQVRIIGPTSNLQFRQNKITGGLNTIFDSLGLYPSGLEIGSTNINNLRIYCNEISGNLGSGIVQPSPVTGSGQISVDGNKIWGNGLDMNTVSANITETNCYNDQCNLSCMTP